MESLALSSFFMKKLLVVTGLLALIMPSLVFAAVLRNDSDVNSKEVVAGNLYLAGSTPVVAGTVQGDLMVAGGNILMNGTIQQDAMVVGGTVIVTGHIGGDLRVFGGNVTIDGPIDGEVVMFGGNIKIGPHTVVKGDLVVYGGKVELDPSSQVMGQKKITSDEDQKKNGASDDEADTWMKRFASSAFWVALAVDMIGLVLVAALIFGLWGGFTNKAANLALTRGEFWKSFGLGLLLLIVTPLVAVICMLSGFGLLLGFLLLFLYIISILISMVFAGVIFGGLMMKFFIKSKKFQLKWGWVIGGVVVLHLLNLIPVIGGLVGFVFFLFAWGILVRSKWVLLKKA